MKYVLVFAVIGACLTIAGCGVFDAAFGYQPPPDGSPPGIPGHQDPGGGILGLIAGILLPGGVGAAAGSILGRIYGKAREKQYYGVARAVVPAIDELLGLFGEKKKISLSKEELLEIIVRWQEQLGERDNVNKLRAEL